MENNEIYKIQRHIQYISHKLHSLEAALSELNTPLNVELKIKWDEYNAKFIQDDPILRDLEKRLGL